MRGFFRVQVLGFSEGFAGVSRIRPFWGLIEGFKRFEREEGFNGFRDLTRALFWGAPLGEDSGNEDFSPQVDEARCFADVFP